MGTVGTITKLATGVAGKAAHAVIHPKQTVATVTGHARDLAATVTRKEEAIEAAAPAAAKPRAKKEPQVVPSPPRNTKPAKAAQPAKSVEPSVTEPKAASRQAAHQGRGDEPTDDWHDELDDGTDLNPATGRPHSTPDADEPLLDPSAAKAIRSEAETMSKAADQSKED